MPVNNKSNKAAGQVTGDHEPVQYPRPCPLTFDQVPVNELAVLCDIYASRVDDDMFWFAQDMALIANNAHESIHSDYYKSLSAEKKRHYDAILYQKLLAHPDMKMMHHFRDAMKYYFSQAMQVGANPLPVGVIILMTGKVLAPYKGIDRIKRFALLALVASCLLFPVGGIVLSIMAAVVITIVVPYLLFGKAEKADLHSLEEIGDALFAPCCLVMGIIGFSAFGPIGASVVVAVMGLAYLALNCYADGTRLAKEISDKESDDLSDQDLLAQVLPKMRLMHHFREALLSYITEARAAVRAAPVGAGPEAEGVAFRSALAVSEGCGERDPLMPSLVLFLLKYMISSIGDKLSGVRSSVTCGFFPKADTLSGVASEVPRYD
jgi:hypothetical protein